MIRIHELHKHFGKLHVLKGVSCAMQPGSICAILGPNGSGKTTLMKSLLGLVHPDAGSIEVHGLTAKGNAEYRRFIGYMPQIARFPENLSANELFAMLRDVRHQQEAPELDTTQKELVDLFNLQEHVDKPLRSLSGGTRQKVSAVAAFMFNAPVLLLDEPTAGLDPLSSQRFKEFILAEKAKGKTIVLTSHIMSEIEELADSLIFLLEGVVRYNGSTHELMQNAGSSNLEKAVAGLMQASSYTGVAS